MMFNTTNNYARCTDKVIHSDTILETTTVPAEVYHHTAITQSIFAAMRIHKFMVIK